MHGIFKNNRNKRNKKKKEKKKNNKNKNKNKNKNNSNNNINNNDNDNDNDKNNMMRTKNLKRDKGQIFFPCLVKVGLNSVVLCLSSLYISPFPVALIHTYIYICICINVYHFASFLWFVLARVCFKLLLKTLCLSWLSLRFETSEFSPPSCRMYWRVMWEKSKKSKWIEDVLAFNSPKARREMNLDDILIYCTDSTVRLDLQWHCDAHITSARGTWSFKVNELQMYRLQPGHLVHWQKCDEDIERGAPSTGWRTGLLLSGSSWPLQEMCFGYFHTLGFNLNSQRCGTETRSKELWASHGFAVQRIKGIKRCYIFFHSFGVQSEGAQLLPLQEILEKWCEEQRKAIDSVYNGLKDRLP